MQTWGTVISIVSGCLTLIALITIFVKLGKEKGINETILKEMRKDIDENKGELKKDIDENKDDINNLGQKVNAMQIENVKLISTLSSDLGWIKSSLIDIKTEIKKKTRDENE